MLLAPGVGAAVVLFVSAMRQGVQQPIVIALVIACALQVYFVFLPVVRREVRFTLLGLALRLCAANAVGWGVAWLLWPSGQPGLVSALMHYVGPPV
jgi:predicted permease